MEIDIEHKTVTLCTKDKDCLTANLTIYEPDPNDGDKVLLELTVNEQTISYAHDDFFTALQMIRRDLEQQHLQIRCNGAARNVYPSPMQFDMGPVYKAYKLSLGQQAQTADLVHIFECDAGLEFVSVAEQKAYYDEWIHSITRR